jgi:hypothetical protein
MSPWTAGALVPDNSSGFGAGAATAGSPTGLASGLTILSIKSWRSFWIARASSRVVDTLPSAMSDSF